LTPAPAIPYHAVQSSPQAGAYIMGQLFSFAFRPLFALAIIYALLSVGWWSLAWSGHLPLPTQWSNPIFWHAHEMLFGFAGAAIGGFALTAVANWTGRPPVAGVPLMILSGLWLAARLCALMDGPMALPATAFTDLSYNILLCALFAREVIAANNRRNLKLLIPLTLFTLANATFYWMEWHGEPWTRTALLAGIFIVTLLITIIGGRIIPAFTGNWLAQQAREKQLPPPSPLPGFGTPDLLATLATVAFAISFLIDSQSTASLILGLVAAGSQLLRWSRWRSLATLASPLVWILHVAYLWIPVGLALLAASCSGYITTSAGFHALTTGAISSMILAVAGRAALGHTNRPLHNHPLLTASYIGISAAAALRVLASLQANDMLWFNLATLCWVFSFLCFALRYLPILLGPPLPQSGP
jgi:uncharacterized protein involved in response to NO